MIVSYISIVDKIPNTPTITFVGLLEQKKYDFIAVTLILLKLHGNK